MNYTPLDIDGLIKGYMVQDHENFLIGILVMITMIIGIFVGKAL